MKIQEIKHPDYSALSSDWFKWRLTYKGGRDFIEQYLRPFSKRETIEDFIDRKSITYCPSFAKAGLNEVKNSIFQRMIDIVRIGGSKSYQDAVLGLNGGVDLTGSSMNSYLGCRILKELLSMGKVGVYVDMPTIERNTLIDTKNKRPYLYFYCAEDILSWSYDKPDEFSQLLFYDHIFDYDSDLELPDAKIDRYRLLSKNPNGTVSLKFFNSDSLQIDIQGNLSNQEYILNIPNIPFVLFELPTSLLEDVSDYQIALLNLESADINYARKANFPFYTEQYNPTYDGNYNQGVGTADKTKEKDTEVKVGPVQGRRYGKDLDRPAFINPSPEPLRVSMEKVKQLKEDIRQLINLAVENLPRIASAEAKHYDDRGLESGLHFIGLNLEKGERKLATYWSMYENSEIAAINYPESYSIRTEDDRQKEAEEKSKLLDIVPSDTYRRAVCKEIAKITIRHKVTNENLEKIFEEIDTAPTLTSDVKAITQDFENGFVSTETASIARGYKPGEVEKAKQDHAERVARVLTAQTSPGGQATGVIDTQLDQATSSDQKIGKNKRGKGR